MDRSVTVGSSIINPSSLIRDLGVILDAELTIQVAQLWQRDRASSINDFRWGDQFEAIMD